MKTKFLVLLIIGILGIVLISGCAEKPITGTEWFQTGNVQDITKLQTKQSQELEDNFIGIDLLTYYPEACDSYSLNNLILEQFGNFQLSNCTQIT